MDIEADDFMRRQWENYRKDSFFIGEETWDEILGSVRQVAETVL